MVNEWTRDDLPDASVATDKYGAIGPMYFPAVDDYRDAVVAHLNANGGLPASDDRWRRAHSIVEQERDQARESLRRLRAETDFDLFTVRDQLKQCRGEREQMTRDREEWKARAESAEARTAPAVTRDDVEKVLDTGIRGTTDGGLIDQDTSIPSGECVRLAVDAVCDLLGIEAEQAEGPVEAGQALWVAVWGHKHPPGAWFEIGQGLREEYALIETHIARQEASDE